MSVNIGNIIEYLQDQGKKNPATKLLKPPERLCYLVVGYIQECNFVLWLLHIHRYTNNVASRVRYYPGYSNVFKFLLDS